MRRRVAVLALIAAAVGTSGWIWLRTTPEDLMAEFVAELRARGEPITIADMEPPMPERADNGADDVFEALGWLDDRLAQENLDIERKIRGTHADLYDYRWNAYYAGPWHMDLDEPWHEHATPEQFDELRGFLRTLDPLFEGIAAATSKSEIAWPLPEPDDGTAIFGLNGWEDMRRWRNAHQLVSTRAIVAAAAADRLDAMTLLLAHVRRVRVRTYMGHVSAAAYRRESCAELRDGVEAGRLDATQIRGRIDGLLRGGYLATIPRVMRAQRADLIWQFPQLLDESAQRQLKSALRTLDEAFNKRPKPSRRERVGRAVEGALEGYRFDGPAYVAALREYDALIPAEGAWSSEAEATITAVEGHPAHSVIPGAQRLIKLLRSVDAAEALARVALAAGEYRAGHGDWPQSSADLSPLFPDGVPVDPYTDAPFDMTRDGPALLLRAARPHDTENDGPDEELRDHGLEWRLTPR